MRIIISINPPIKKINRKTTDQIDTLSVSRVTNAAHYEYFLMVRKRTTAIRIDHPLRKQVSEE